jgi:hypothetical protein
MATGSDTRLRAMLAATWPVSGAEAAIGIERLIQASK